MRRKGKEKLRKRDVIWGLFVIALLLWMILDTVVKDVPITNPGLW
ncbi:MULTISPECIES: hypothetical protein [Paenibacillus]|nr:MULTISPECIES: hypothetical protein [Paenibacillus]